MKTGFIGAGKVGCSLGKCFAQHGVSVSGYYSLHAESAKEAASFTGSAAYGTAEELIEQSDCIFLTVPDGQIRTVYEETDGACLNGKVLFHCSGALAAGDAFPGIGKKGACGASVHPIFPVSNKESVWQELPEAYFCLEGDETAVAAAEEILAHCGIRFQRIDPESKTKYHAGCVFASNLVCALMQESFDLLCECGFTPEGAREALRPLILSNLNHVLEDGTEKALTGPVERCDTGTVKKHLAALSGETEALYRVLSRSLVNIAQQKHPETDYAPLREILKQET